MFTARYSERPTGELMPGVEFETDKRYFHGINATSVCRREVSQVAGVNGFEVRASFRSYELATEAGECCRRGGGVRS